MSDRPNRTEQRRFFASLGAHRVTQESLASYLAQVTGRPVSRAQIGHYYTGHDAAPLDVVLHAVEHAADGDEAVAQSLLGPVVLRLGLMVHVLPGREQEQDQVMVQALRIGAAVGGLHTGLLSSLADGRLDEVERRDLLQIIVGLQAQLHVLSRQLGGT